MFPILPIDGGSGNRLEWIAVGRPLRFRGVRFESDPVGSHA